MVLPIPVLPRLKTDLLEIMLACTNGTLDKINIEWYHNAAVCVILASGGYPVSYEKGRLFKKIKNSGGVISPIKNHSINIRKT